MTGWSVVDSLGLVLVSSGDVDSSGFVVLSSEDAGSVVVSEDSSSSELSTSSIADFKVLVALFISTCVDDELSLIFDALLYAVFNAGVYLLSGLSLIVFSAVLIADKRAILSISGVAEPISDSVFEYEHVLPVNDVTVMSIFPAIPVISDVCVAVPVAPSFTITLYPVVPSGSSNTYQPSESFVISFVPGQSLEYLVTELPLPFHTYTAGDDQSAAFTRITGFV